MVDIRDKLVTPAATKQQTAPRQQDTSMPVIPTAAIATQLPPEVIQALESSKQASQASINAERRRIDEAATATKIANKEIDSASKRLQEINGSIALDFQGIFDSDYNRKFQGSRITRAKQALKNKAVELDLERKREALNLKESNIPLEAYKLQLEFLKDKANLSVAQNNAIVQSNAARKQILTLQQSRLTQEDILNADKTQSFDKIMTPEFVKDYTRKMEKFNTAMETADLANRDKRFDLSRKIQTAALEDVPLQWSQAVIQEADKTGLQRIVVPGSNTVVSVDQLRKVTATRIKQQEDSFTTIANQQNRLVQNNAVVSEALGSVGTMSSIYSSGNPDLGRMSELGSLNLLNIDDKVVSGLDMRTVHPALRTELQDALQSQANLNAKQEAKGVITVQDTENVKQKFVRLNEKAKLIQKDTVESASKQAKPALKEWFSAGRMSDQDNSAKLLVANSVSMPNLGDSPSLSAAYQVMLNNIASDVVEDDVNFAEMDATERTNSIFQALASSGFRGKVDAKNVIIKAMSKKDGSGRTPLDAFAQTRTFQAMDFAMGELSNKYPEFADFFTKLKNTTQLSNTKDIAIVLTELSFSMQQKNPDIPDMVLSSEFINQMNLYLEGNKLDINSQVNPVRGSFMNLMFSTDPTVFLGEAITTSFGQPARTAWDNLVKTNKELQDFKIDAQGMPVTAADRERLRGNNGVNIALPQIN